MAYEDLEEHGLFLPEKAWGELDLSTDVNVGQLAATGILGIGSCVLMVVGDGRALTWIGVLGFFVFMFAFTYVSNAGIEAQNDEIEELIAKSQTEKKEGKSGEAMKREEMNKGEEEETS